MLLKLLEVIIDMNFRKIYLPFVVLSVIILPYHLSAQVKESLQPNIYPELPDIEVIYLQEARPTSIKPIATFELLPGQQSTACNLTEVIEQAKINAFKAGGNALYVYELLAPKNNQGCFGLKADVYKLDRPYFSEINRDISVDEDITQTEGYTYKEIMPLFPGGNQQFVKYLYENIRYPFEAYSRNIQGQVKVSFTVSPAGKIEDIKVVHPVNRDLDREAIRLISAMPEWVPGYQNDKPVPVVYTVPINFFIKGPFSKRKKRSN